MRPNEYDDILKPSAASGGTIDEDTPTENFVAWTLDRFRHQRLAITTSFGLEGCALIDMYAARGQPVTVYYLDTGFFFPETYALRDRMAARYPHLEFIDRGPDLSPELQAEMFGDALWETDPDLCCRLRKVAPMQDLLREVDVWVTALTRSQSPTRAGIQLIEWDRHFQILKVNPLVRWERRRAFEYVRTHQVPYNPLHERGYPSIGCTHCTRPVARLGPDDYSREGRWSGRRKVECGLHLPVLSLEVTAS
jgi:phosphoadenosine phosphosulfate reductase